MNEMWLLLGACAVIAVTVVALFASRRTVLPEEPRRLWTVSRANTSDGATANLEVEVVVELIEPGPGRTEIDEELVDLIESHVRRRITEHPVASLPSVGDDAPFVPPDVSPGVRLLRAVVTTSDVEVTPELRRLVTDRSVP
jgi:hypothetical protein